MPDNMYYENEQKQWKDIRSRYVQDAEWREFFFELKMEETTTERGQGDERAWWMGTIRVERVSVWRSVFCSREGEGDGTVRCFGVEILPYLPITATYNYFITFGNYYSQIWIDIFPFF